MASASVDVDDALLEPPVPPPPPVPTPPPPQSYGFDLLFLRRFCRLHRVLFPGLLSPTFGLFSVLLCVSVGEQFLAYRVGLISGEFYKVLGQKDLSGFQTATLKAVLIILTMTLVKSFRVFVTRTMTVGWRRCLNLALHKMYFEGIRYYQLNVLDHCSLDNPDQRMTSDVNLLCTQYGLILTDLLLSPLLISYYSYSAYSRSGWIGPTSMFVLFLASTVLNKLLMSPIVNLSVEQERREGDFRFKHVSVRVNSESLAFLGSAKVEAVKVDAKLFALCDVQQSVFNRQLLLDLATNSFDYLGSIASFLVIAVPIFAGAFDDVDAATLAQLISENAFVCMYLIYQFSKLVDMSSTLTSMAGVTHRIMELAETMASLPTSGPEDRDDDDDGNGACGDPKGDDQGDIIFKVRDVDLSPPQGSAPLVSKLIIDFKLGESVLIMGRSSAGKSSILRALRGLWDLKAGSIQRCSALPKDILFLPQKPFFTDGSIREQIIYPLQGKGIRTREGGDAAEWIVDTLEELGLGGLVRRCGGDIDVDPRWSWYDVLSPGEVQRLSFMRLFFHRPAMAFLDEATSALSADVEELLYQRCLDLGITLVSVGHRENLRRFHRQILHIGLEDGAWTLEDVVS